MQVTFNLDKEGLYRITGFIDRLDKTHDGVFEIHDYKTGNSLLRKGNGFGQATCSLPDRNSFYVAGYEGC